MRTNLTTSTSTPSMALVGDGEVVTARLMAHTCAGCGGEIAIGTPHTVVRFRGGRWDRRHAGCGVASDVGRAPLAVQANGGLDLAA